jgi:TfoX/Sxy family transcriptional regulator of competence genes
MAYNQKLYERLKRSFADVPKVEEKKMFRGITFMVNGKMCVSVGDDEIMCRIDASIHEEAIKRKGCRTMQMKGKDYIGYVLVSGDALPTKKELDYWINLALDFNKKAKASPKKAKKMPLQK